MSESRKRSTKKRSTTPESYDPGVASSAPANLRYAVSALVCGVGTVAVFAFAPAGWQWTAWLLELLTFTVAGAGIHFAITNGEGVPAGMSITVCIISVLALPGLLLIQQIRPPDYQTWRDQLAEVAEAAEAKIDGAEQLAQKASSKIGGYREQARILSEESSYVGGMLSQMNGAMRSIDSKLPRLTMLANGERDVVLADGRTYTVAELQTLHAGFERSAGDVRALHQELQGNSQMARATLEELQSEMHGLSEVSRLAREMAGSLKLVSKELTERINGPDEKLPSAKRFPRFLKEQREIIGNLTEDLEEIARTFRGASGRTIEIPVMRGTPQQIRDRVAKATQVARDLAKLVR